MTNDRKPVDFGAVLDPANQRCMVHPDQSLMRTRQTGGRTLMTCPVCNTDFFDRMARQPGVITINVGRKS